MARYHCCGGVGPSSTASLPRAEKMNYQQNKHQTTAAAATEEQLLTAYRVIRIQLSPNHIIKLLARLHLNNVVLARNVVDSCFRSSEIIDHWGLGLLRLFPLVIFQ